MMIAHRKLYGQFLARGSNTQNHFGHLRLGDYSLYVSVHLRRSVRKHGQDPVGALPVSPGHHLGIGVPGEKLPVQAPAHQRTEQTGAQETLQDPQYL